MKQAKQLLEKLPEPYRSQALENFDEEFFENNNEREKPMRTIGAALLCSFEWEHTKQGYDYWSEAFTEEMT